MRNRAMATQQNGASIHLMKLILVLSRIVNQETKTDLGQHGGADRKYPHSDRPVRNSYQNKTLSSPMWTWDTIWL